MDMQTNSHLLSRDQASLVYKIRRALHHGDIPWNILLVGMAVLVLFLMAAIAWTIWTSSADARIKAGITFVLPTKDASWNPAAEIFQAWPFIYGTIITSFVAMLIAVPISLAAAVFQAELIQGWLRTALGTMVELLAAIPSVIYGLWGIYAFLPKVVVPFGNFVADTLGNIPGMAIFLVGPIPQSGSSRLAAALILTIMVIPTITSVTRDVLLAIPQSQREASLALGATHWETIWRVVLPYGLSGILGAVILGLGRALGETMAVTMVIGNSIEGSLSLLRPGYTMSSIIANEFAEAYNAMHTSALLYVAVVLFLLTLLINILARVLVWRVSRSIVTEGCR